MHIGFSIENVKARNDVNDATECGIKLRTDFHEAVRSEEHIQKFVQSCRKWQQENSKVKE